MRWEAPTFEVASVSSAMFRIHVHETATNRAEGGGHCSVYVSMVVGLLFEQGFRVCRLVLAELASLAVLVMATSRPAGGGGSGGGVVVVGWWWWGGGGGGGGGVTSDYDDVTLLLLLQIPLQFMFIIRVMRTAKLLMIVRMLVG